MKKKIVAVCLDPPRRARLVRLQEERSFGGAKPSLSALIGEIVGDWFRATDVTEGQSQGPEIRS